MAVRCSSWDDPTQYMPNLAVVFRCVDAEESSDDQPYRVACVVDVPDLDALLAVVDHKRIVLHAPADAAYMWDYWAGDATPLLSALYTIEIYDGYRE